MKLLDGDPVSSCRLVPLHTRRSSFLPSATFPFPAKPGGCSSFPTRGSFSSGDSDVGCGLKEGDAEWLCQPFFLLLLFFFFFFGGGGEREAGKSWFPFLWPNQTEVLTPFPISAKCGPWSLQLQWPWQSGKVIHYSVRMLLVFCFFSWT